MKRSRKISIGTIVLFVVCSLIYYRNDLAVLIGNKTNSIKVVNVNDNTSLENSNIPDYTLDELNKLYQENIARIKVNRVKKRTFKKFFIIHFLWSLKLD